MKNKTTAKYKIVPEVSGNRYYFFCDISGALICITKPYKANSPEKELSLAWEFEGKEHFNKCHKCGNWVTNVMYNADVLECVDCAPWESKPNFCKFCGEAVTGDEDICLSCGEHLRYQGSDLSA